jgi:nicotinamidase/pyrazinamidase
MLTEHCLVGTIGHCVVDNVQEALDSWAVRRGKCVDFVFKSPSNLTEMFSAVRADVPIPSDKSTHINEDLLNVLGESTKVHYKNCHSFFVIVVCVRS